MLCDYHLHSEFSFDSSEKIENLCKKAIEEGISEIAITDHAELPLRESAPWPDFVKREKIIKECSEKYSDKLIIRNGIEVGQPWHSREMESLLTSYHPDFIIASVHELDGFPDPRTIKYTGEMIPSFVDAYLEQMTLMAENCDYDVLGHVTYLFRFFPENLAAEYTPEFFLKKYKELFRAVISRGKGIEVNCSGLRMPTIRNLLPSLQILRLYRELGGEIVTVGSDGHSCRSAFSGLEEGYKALRDAGFTSAACFEERKARLFGI